MRTTLVDYTALSPGQLKQLNLTQVDAAQKEFSGDIAGGRAFPLFKRTPALCIGTICMLHSLQIDKGQQGHSLGRRRTLAAPAR
ncbi:hypothetical protein [Pseudomonas agarici]|uniref:hypothetical protein n=1 Tax=Pseudomonas agarici TaxID=46677 RepID=UPI000942CEE6|nr:hypothetical protein [Pseudomonas agarici]NWB94065.1 hypothetical protein [Pseudomonas agarici]NWC11786.1 hypothetical protein [Pseudomonas agarici]